MLGFLNSSQDPGVIVTFSGGLGAQIFSAAIYSQLRALGQNVYADLDYFQHPAKVATVGNKGEISYWPYELDVYGLPQSHFATREFRKRKFWERRPTIIADGEEKMRLAIESIRQSEISKLFPIPADILDQCHAITNGQDYLCIHIRRGDYVNVASHLVADDEFITMAKLFSGKLANVIVLSDSDVSERIKTDLAALFPHCHYIIGGDLFIAHALLRRAKYLICSNSQFSLSGALLNQVADRIYLPNTWFGEGDTDIQKPINNICQPGEATGSFMPLTSAH